MSAPMNAKRRKVGILGATGTVGQNYISFLENHPWFDITFLAASSRSSGQTYEEATQSRWKLNRPIQTSVSKLNVHSVEQISKAVADCEFVFSALDTDTAKLLEPEYAKAGLPVFSNASAFRGAEDIPMLIPEVNPKHLEVLNSQKKKRGWGRGFIVVKPNCSIQSFVLPLSPLHERFGVHSIFVTTMQALSGAGYPGVASLDILDNVIPFISGEEEKTEIEPLKIFGSVNDGAISYDSKIKISAHCNRVSTSDGHLACVSVKFEKKPTHEEIVLAWKNFEGLPQKLKLPSAPSAPVIYRTEVDRPQTRLDRSEERGMAAVVGRLRPCSLYDYRFVGLSHNTIRGAAGGGVLNAELALELGYL